jgi:hypothetical protein
LKGLCNLFRDSLSSCNWFNFLRANFSVINMWLWTGIEIFQHLRLLTLGCPSLSKCSVKPLSNRDSGYTNVTGRGGWMPQPSWATYSPVWHTVSILKKLAIIHIYLESFW